MSEVKLTPEDLKILSQPFPSEKVGVKIQSFSKNKDKALLVCYLQHTDVYSRLETIDPSWSCRTTRVEKRGYTVTVAMQITLKGVSRENVGEGEDEKSAYSDALKRTAMLFGIGRYLYDQENAWVPYDDSRDRFKSWTLEEFNRAIRAPKDRLPTAPDPESPPKAQPPAQSPGESKGGPGNKPPEAKSKAKDKEPPKESDKKTSEQGKSDAATQKPVRSRDVLSRILMAFFRPYMTKFPNTQFIDILQQRYGVKEARLCTVEQLEDMVTWMEASIDKDHRASIEADLLDLAKRLEKNHKWLESKFQEKFGKPLAQCSLSQLQEGVDVFRAALKGKKK